MWKEPAGIQLQRWTATPWPSAKGPRPARAFTTTNIAISHEATTATTGIVDARLPSRRPNSAVNANPARGRAGMSWIRVSIGPRSQLSLAQRVVLVDKRRATVPVDGDHDREPYG